MGLSDWLRKQLGTHPSKADYMVLLFEEDWNLLNFAGAYHMKFTQQERVIQFVRDLWIFEQGIESHREHFESLGLPLFLNRDSLQVAQVLTKRLVWLLQAAQSGAADRIEGLSLGDIGPDAEPPLRSLEEAHRAALAMQERLLVVEREHSR